jgi:hypothetical protein
MDRGRDAPKFAKYKIWGLIRNLGPVSESNKRKGKGKIAKEEGSPIFFTKEEGLCTGTAVNGPIVAVR